ncbi:MAG: type I-U CRISPR-associated protein Csx17 [bacterium]|nr:type I-U CRISPR-associated protein Csx17 [Acidimicrobiia bacterium]MCY4650957.1 type I-U CRISPR-associated protein Csx17 [bacterium]
MTVLTLPGCRSTPLLSYLQGLGVLRVLHHQHLPGVMSCWQGDSLHLGGFEGEELIDFFLTEYKPTPILSPWNGRGGFRTRKPQKGERAVRTITESDDPRLESLQRTIEKAQKLVDLAIEMEWADQTGKVTNKNKPLFLAACRSEFPDEALDWLDAVFVLSDDKKPNYPLLLGGTGGALGSGDISASYLESVNFITDSKRRSWSRELLSNALFAQGNPKLHRIPIGHLMPGTAETVNSSAFGSATSAVNPWSFVLGMEGTLLFASGVARRFRGSRGMATTPFTVSKSPVGYSAADNEAIKGEMWLPIWERPMTLPEVRRILAEGRLSWNGTHASNGVDAAKAISTLGVDRGLNRFERYVVATRYGNMTLAVPVGSFPVVKQPAERVHIIREIDPWLNRVRRGTLPASARTALRRVDAAQMQIVQTPHTAGSLQEFLVEIAALEWIVSRNPDLRARARSPVPPLSIERWAELLDDETTEWKLAVSIGTQRDRFPRGQHLSHSEQRRGAAACFLRPVKLHAEPFRRHLLDWTDRVSGSANPVSWSTDHRLSAMLIHRSILCGDRQAGEGVVTIGSGAPIAFDRFSPVPMTHISAFLHGPLDRKRLGRLIPVAAMLNRPPSWKGSDPDQNHSPWRQFLSPARALLGPFFHSRPLRKETDSGEEAEHLLIPSLSWPQKLRAGQTRSVATEALIRLRAAGYRPGVRPQSLQVTSEERFVASLLIPAFTYAIQNAIEIVCPPTPDPTIKGET